MPIVECERVESVYTSRDGWRPLYRNWRLDYGLPNFTSPTVANGSVVFIPLLSGVLLQLLNKMVFNILYRCETYFEHSSGEDYYKSFHCELQAWNIIWTSSNPLKGFQI